MEWGEKSDPMCLADRLDTFRTTATHVTVSDLANCVCTGENAKCVQVDNGS